jgi:uncharacterized protein (DUF302 family)
MTAGLIVVPSAHGFAETLQRLIDVLHKSGVEIFAQIDHAAGAQAAGLTLRPTTVVMFGAARAGTPLMAAEQTLGLDLPLRALVYEDAAGKTQVAYNAPDWIVERHWLRPDTFPSVAGMTKLLASVVAEAARGES